MFLVTFDANAALCHRDERGHRTCSANRLQKNKEKKLDRNYPTGFLVQACVGYVRRYSSNSRPKKKRDELSVRTFNKYRWMAVQACSFGSCSTMRIFECNYQSLSNGSGLRRKATMKVTQVAPGHSPSLRFLLGNSD